MPTTRQQRQLEMEHAVKQWGQEVEGAAKPRICRQERQHQQRSQKEPGARRNSPQGLRAVARLAPGARGGLSSSSEEVLEDAWKEENKIMGPVLTLKRLFWQEHGVERRDVGTQTDPVAIMSAEEVLTGEAGTADVLSQELRPYPSNVNSRYRIRSSPPRINIVPEVEIRIDTSGPRVEEEDWRETGISATAEKLALEAGVDELTSISADRGWGRRVESILGTVYDATVPSFARFWEQDDPFAIISGGAR